MEKIEKRLLEKSIESFILGLEVYNKPTIKYRIEGFSFFCTNAWELMLKAYLITRDGEKSIYYRDNPNRTISLTDAIKKVYTNKNDPLRKNLETILELRNMSTHFITQDYETIYAPLFQVCVINFSSELSKRHSVDITTYIAQNFLTLSINMEELTSSEIKATYSPVIAKKLIDTKNTIGSKLDNLNGKTKFSIPISQNIYITKNKDDADLLVAIDNQSDTNVQKIKELKDPTKTHPYAYNDIITGINSKITATNVHFEVTQKVGIQTKFTSRHLNAIMNFYDFKNNTKYAYKHKIGSRVEYTYSQQLIDFIFSEIKKGPNLFVNEVLNAKK